MAVGPACRQGRAAPEAEVVFAAKVFREGFANAGEERRVVRREVEFRHQVAKGQVPPSVRGRAGIC